MNDDLNQKAKDVLQALNDLIKGHPWDESNFLKVMGRELRKIRDDLTAQTNAPKPDEANVASRLARKIALHSGQQEIFIALYSLDGSNLQTWERIVVNLRKQMISRPIYSNENDIKSWIKTKDNKINEGYLSIYVSQTDLLAIAEDKAPIDKLGKKLLVLKDNTINLDNIHHFVHESGTYRYAHGRLVKVNQGES